MFVKIGNKIYSSAREPILVVLNEDERHNITNAPPGEVQTCSYPPLMPEKDVKRWMVQPGDMTTSDAPPAKPKPRTKNKKKSARRASRRPKRAPQ